MSQSSKERTAPCTRCKNRHLKCEAHTPCNNCKKSSLQCLRPKRAFRFKKAAQPKLGFTFDSNQTWLATDKHDALSYVDLTKEVARATNGFAPLDPRSEAVPTQESQNDGDEGGQVEGSTSSFARLTGEISFDTPVNDLSDQTMVISQYGFGLQPEPQSAQGGSHAQEEVSSGRMQTRSMAHVQATLTVPNDDQSILTSPRDEVRSSILTSPSLSSRSQLVQNPPYPSYTFPSPYFASPDALHGLPQKATHQAYTNLQEACLVKHFVNNLAHAFETTDRDRHFSIVVPQRAMFCPVLLYAILTASARHLTTRWHSTNNNKPIEFEGIPLPDLDGNSAIEYHNVCITYLMEVLNDPKKTINQDALIAATILRYHEQLDTPLTGWDSETYLSVLQGVIESQQNESFYSLRTIHGPPRDCDIYASNSASLTHSACLIALAQEIWSVLLYRRPFRLPLCPDNDYSDLDGAVDDFTWANRILLWCADVCRFAFGGERGVVETRNRVECWNRLKVVQDKWDTVQPACFKPLYYRNADPTRGEYFAKEWHMNECQVLALQHFEMARMLLAAYDPHLQRIGLGASSSTISLEAQLRRSTMRLCGLALANVKYQPGMVTAAVGISMCGEYIRDAGEQSAIEGFLDTLEREHAWPTQSVLHALRDAWEARRKQAEGLPASEGQHLAGTSFNAPTVGDGR